MAEEHHDGLLSSMQQVTVTLAFATDDQNTPEIYCARHSHGLIELPATIEGTQINFKVRAKEDGTLKVPKDKDGTALAAITVSGGDIVEIPDICFKAIAFAVFFETAQTADREVAAVLKR